MNDIASYQTTYLKIAVEMVNARQRIQQVLEKAYEDVSKSDLNLYDPKVRNAVWNDFGEFLFNHGLFTDCERLNKLYLETLESCDKSAKIPRGQVLYNLGISQINQGNFEQGVPNILKALDEDMHIYGETKASSMNAALLRETFKTYTASILDADFLVELNKNIQLNPTKKIKGIDFLDAFPGDAERLLFAKSISTFTQTIIGADIFSKVVAFDNLKIICLLLENVLKKGGIQGDIINLVKTVFDDKSKTTWLKVFSANTKALCHFKDPTTKGALKKFESNLLLIQQKRLRSVPHGFSSSEYYLVEIFLLSCLFRHFTAHLFDLNASILTGKQTYDPAFRAVVSALLYSLYSQTS